MMSQPNGLEGWFDQVWVINLKRRPDRLLSFWQNIEGAHWPFKRPQVYSAIEGNKVGVPKFWQTGGGSYGCLRSHMNILERAIQDDVESLLVLEDDAEFAIGFRACATTFLDNVPADWQCLMLGGQHVNSSPFEVIPGVLRAGAGGGIQRTHCYALRGREIMQALYRMWSDAAVHCDWVMGPCAARYNTYAPDPFLVGQARGSSDISGAHNPPKFWRSALGTEPVIILKAPREVMEALNCKGWHTGFSRQADTGIDEGLASLFKETLPDTPHRAQRLKQWIDMIQNEVASMTAAVCTIWHPQTDANMVRSLIKGRVLEISANSLEEALSQLPNDLYFSKGNSAANEPIRVILLRAPRAVMEVLRDVGWHTGYWRDEITGYDNGVRRIMASSITEVQRRNQLQEIIGCLHQQSKQIRDGVATIWHSEITSDMIHADGVEVFEIEAANAAEAIKKLESMTNVKS